MFPAHIRGGDNKQIQSVAEHLQETAILAGEACAPIGLTQTVFFAGLLHDMGKLTEKFKQYLEQAANGVPVRRGSVNHTFCGVIFVLERYGQPTRNKMERFTAELIAYAIGAHHGLFDIGNAENGFLHRLQKEKSELCYEEAVANFLQIVSEAELDSRFAASVAEIAAVAGKFSGCVGFQRGVLARLLLSALMEADRRNTAEFMQQMSMKMPEADWSGELTHLESKLADFSCETPINQARQAFSDVCSTFAQEHNGGIYRLTLPTGAGKTLASLRFGFANAKKFKKRRIFFVIPLLSVIEQNAKVLRDMLSNEGILTEHHSNAVREPEADGEYDLVEALTESWNYPIVITTLVQLLQTLFAGKTSCVRRMQALCGSVLLIDEVQSLPVKIMYPFCQAVRFLAQFCGVTVVLSSATQPEFDALPKYALPIDGEIVPYDEMLFSVFKRTEIVDKADPHGWDWEQLADFARDIVSHANSLLIVCNTKASALNIYVHLDGTLTDCKLFYLSAAMCPQHRFKTVSDIKDSLAAGKKVVCAATQVVEAGIDFSFEHVIRVLAGVDNIVQAAGRCNRNGEYSGTRAVFVVNLKQDCEDLKMLSEIQTAQTSARTVLKMRDITLDSAQGIASYYRTFYGMSSIQNNFSYPLKYQGVDTSLFELLGTNTVLRSLSHQNDSFLLRQAFKTAGEQFSVFAEDTTDVLVEYDTASHNMITALCGTPSWSELKTLLAQAKPYFIHLYAYQFNKLKEEGMLYPDSGGHIWILQKQCYNKLIGLDMTGSGGGCPCI